jgi:GNAT superfamily N-acetyltransferase
LVDYSPPLRLERTHVRDGFDSGAGELDDWLVKFAWENQRANNATTFVSTSDGRVVGYYALTVASIAKAEAPEVLSKGSPQQTGCLLLARLAVDQTVQGCGLGAALLGDCMRRSAQLSMEIGFKALLVHCRDQAARDFYLSKADFLTSPIEDLQLFLPMKWILANVQHSGPAG